MSGHRLIFLQLNEINFRTVRQYVERYDDLPAFKELLSQFQAFETYAESEYDQLEPWIQWVSAHTGRTYADHGVFRLGDITRSSPDLVQVFEALEARGLRVGAVSPMNARNRLTRPAYFIPDPWTDTPSDPSGFSRRLTAMLRQTVNENSSGRVSMRSGLALLEALVRSFDMRRTGQVLRTILASRRSPWLKSLVLDQVIHLVHRRLWHQNQPDATFLFLNAGAHVQHHYFLNSEFSGVDSKNPPWYLPAQADPIRDMLRVYDRILGDHLAMAGGSVRLVVATGLSQVPYDRVKYYYRLRDHAGFLGQLDLGFRRVLPRMTRDFEVECDDGVSAEKVARTLARMTLARDGERLFGEIDVRGKAVFATLTYPNEIRVDDEALLDGRRLPGFGQAVDFVAIKNGMHDTRGYVFVSPNLSGASVPTKPVHVASLFDLTLGAVA